MAIPDHPLGRLRGHREVRTLHVDWSDLGAEATVYYVDRELRPRGVLLWNRFGQVDAARELIRAGQPVTRGALGMEVSHV